MKKEILYMPINQLRRDPITGRWAIILNDDFNLDDLIMNNNKKKFDVRTGVCPFCEQNEKMTPPEIMALRSDSLGPNAPGWRVRVIPDRNPVLQIHGDLNNRGLGLYDVLDGIGAHEIVIETPRHYESFVDLSEDQITAILQTYQERIFDLKKDERLRYIVVHKNTGEAIGETADHSYSFVIGSPVTPKRVKDELVHSLAHYNYKERCVFCDIIKQELMMKERLILEDGVFFAYAPFASRRPFEMWVGPQKHETFFEQNSDIRILARILKALFTKLFKLLNNPDYIMVIHSGPNVRAGRRRGYWQTLEKDYHWHIEITPRLHSDTSLEVSSGFPVNSVPPEKATELLRNIE